MWIKIPNDEYNGIKLISDDGFFIVTGVESGGYRYIPSHVLSTRMYEFCIEALSQYPIVEWQNPEVIEGEV